MTAVTERFLWFSRPHRTSTGRCSINAILAQLLHFINNEVMKQNVRVVTGFAPDLPDVWAEPRELNDVFLNLIVNAIEAMSASHGGTLTVSTRANDRAGLDVSVQDDGPGILPEHRSRLFEPFFSTKPAGQGTGLGLWTVRTILTALKGAVRFETEVGRGTTFIVTLPAADASLKSNPDEPSSLVTAGA
jgi:two-component system NtrC family sensor kinase